MCGAVLAELEKGNFARNIEFDEEQAEIMRSMFLLTDKPIIYVGNIAEDQAGKDGLPIWAAAPICGRA